VKLNDFHSLLLFQLYLEKQFLKKSSQSLYFHIVQLRCVKGEVMLTLSLWFLSVLKVIYSNEINTTRGSRLMTDSHCLLSVDTFCFTAIFLQTIEKSAC